MSFQLKLPEDFFFEVAEQLQGFITDDLSYFIAQLGTGVGPDAYSKIPEVMLKKPLGLRGAYEQAYFFTVLAAQRAIRLEDEKKVPFGTARVFFSQLINLSKQVIIANSSSDGLCDQFGYGCPIPSGSSILASTIRLIGSSDLPATDKDTMIKMLRHNRSGLMLQQALPWVALFGVGSLIISGIGYRRRASSSTQITIEAPSGSSQPD